MSTTLNEREVEVAAELDMEYVAEMAAAIAAELNRGWPVEVAFQPGDMTFYGLVFTPLWVTAIVPQEGEVRACRGMGTHRGATLVSYVDHTAYPIDLSPDRGYLHWSYISEKFFGGSPTSSAVTLTLLLRAISERMPS